MSRRRVSEISLNFDSLTDLVTNLAGGLILMVMLHEGMMHGSVSRVVRGLRTSEPNPASLPDELSLLANRRRELDLQLALAQAAVAELRRTTDQLPLAGSPTGDKTPRPIHVSRRPPMQALSTTGTGAVFVIKDGRVLILDLKDFSDRLGRFTSEAGDPPVVTKSSDAVVPLKSGDFDTRLEVRDKKPFGTLVPKAGTRGEALDEAALPSSRYQAAFAQLDPKNQDLSFFVYPEGFEIFRQLRQEFVARKFNYSWVPVTSGASITLSRGRGVLSSGGP